MASQQCTLCELETPDPPVTEPGTEGVFCCSGCLHVYQLLQEMEDEQAEELRQQTIALRKQEKKAESLPEHHAESFYKVSGMHCATCESFLETLAERQPGIYKCEASYASEMLKVYYDPDHLDAGQLPQTLNKMGYKMHPTDAKPDQESQNKGARLVIGGFFGIIGLMLYILFLYPSYLNIKGFIPVTQTEQLFFISNIAVMTGFVLFYTGFPILRGAGVSISVGKPNMDLLISIAALSAYLYSLGALLSGSPEVYFDVTMAIILAVSIGNYYEKKIKAGTNDILDHLSQKKIQRARVRHNGELKEMDIDEITPGDHLVIRAGERIPIDGEIIEGNGVINEALMTGESMPVHKKEGDRVLSGTILTQNALTIRAGNRLQSTVDELMRLMWNIQSSRPGQQRIADRIAAYFVPAVIVLGMGAFALHLLSGAGITEAMLSALAVLIVSCPCALGLATPLAIASGFRSALKQNIIFRTAAVFEAPANTEIVAFDKTGTLTTGRMELLDDGAHPQALGYAAALEQRSSHPIGKPVAAVESEWNGHVQEFKSHERGISGWINGQKVWVGQPEWLAEQQLSIPEFLNQKIKRAREMGAIPVAIGWEAEVKSVLIVGDRLREDAPEIIQSLKREGKKIAVITGDKKEAAEYIRQQLSPDFLFTEARPASKSNIIQELRKLGKVTMVGDGSNDAPALAEADLGIAFGDLTAIAAESGQVVIPANRLSLVPTSFRAIKLTRRRIYQNLGWAFLYNIITIPLAIAGIINPLFAAIAMASSSLLVVSNSSRSMKLHHNGR